jgi:hypothetical protein
VGAQTSVNTSLSLLCFEFLFVFILIYLVVRACECKCFCGIAIGHVQTHIFKFDLDCSLWSGGGKKCSGAQCLIVHERVCLSKDASGLGFINLEDHNHCLLMRLVNKLLGLDDLL